MDEGLGMNLMQLLRDNPDKLSADILIMVEDQSFGTGYWKQINRRILALNSDEQIQKVLELHDKEVERRELASYKLF
jgi:hypothetical protein